MESEVFGDNDIAMKNDIVSDAMTKDIDMNKYHNMLQ